MHIAPRLFRSRGLLFSSVQLTKLKNISKTCCNSSSNFNRTIYLKACLTNKIHNDNEAVINERGSSVLKEPSEDVKELLDNSATFQDQVPQHKEQVWSTAPYPKGAPRKSQAIHSLRPNVDPKETSILLFPGQGTQYVGMGKSLLKFPLVKELFESASEILGYDLLKLCLKGPKEELDKTAHCQVAILVCSLAAVERLKDETPSVIEKCIAAAGFSIGEISALVFAGVFSFERAVRLVKVRGEAMQLASEMNPGGMMTVLYGPDSKLSEACRLAKEWAMQMGVEKPECTIANYLFPDCKVIAGHNEALNYIEKNAKHYKLRRIKRLPVSGAFHTILMKPAVEPFKKALHRASLNDPMIAVHSNINAKMYKSAFQILHTLPQQIIRPVKWEQTLHILYERPQGVDFPLTYECGPGNSLKTILKMVNAKAADSCKNILT
ncbi:malonyl-CoA-acyl carrier protein transacylase beg [Lycorma delicatula]|uniref:malonyl-CoA-acyl carrier protein transacylase beg n=1 Tax=Lycorma delicatula TaxID=130591 RepID=UPI003F5111DA